ncbi:hypothetical protein E2F46_05270 [Luteimonas aestuarii]|uniref:Uncharacterized protein n=1 Tax=Luteimonas aestuarii TaxID=453837 RepID=A0A4R5TXW3_9GAMM|nr:hypothetical protein [Luteimonas aestuarii]TDK26013.1 hypothetical protein E2F46_05270 [Luteimonas aestuarii]
MNIRDREPLTPEERDLAQRLSRLGGHAEPPAALDAKILAAARNAARPSLHRKRARWPLGMGMAASLALAVGVAWQLRPLPETEVMQAPSETASAAMMDHETPPARTADFSREVEQAAAPAPDAEPQVAVTPAEPAPPDAPTPLSSLQQAPPPAADEALQEEPPAALLFDAPSPPPPPAPPAPPAAAPAAPASAPAGAAAEAADAAAAKVRAQEQERRTARSESTSDTMRAAGARPDRAGETITATGSRVRQAQPALPERADEYIDEPLDDRPPASFATAEARDAWLQRIRELVAEGELDAARASLKEFRRRYPQHSLPADLKALLAE